MNAFGHDRNADARHREPYSTESRHKDEAARGIYTQHGYVVGSLRQFGGYGKHVA